MVFATLLWLGSNSYWQCASHKSHSICWCGVSCADSPAASCILATYPNASKSARNKSISTRPQSATETQAGLKERFCACDQLNKEVPTRTSRAAHRYSLYLIVTIGEQGVLCLVALFWVYSQLCKFNSVFYHLYPPDQHQATTVCINIIPWVRNTFYGQKIPCYEPALAQHNAGTMYHDVSMAFFDCLVLVCCGRSKFFLKDSPCNTVLGTAYTFLCCLPETHLPWPVYHYLHRNLNVILL